MLTAALMTLSLCSTMAANVPLGGDIPAPSLASPQQPLTILHRPNHSYPAQLQDLTLLLGLRGPQPTNSHLLQHGLQTPSTPLTVFPFSWCKRQMVLTG